MPTLTTNYGLQKPLVDNPADEDLYGTQINDDIDEIDSLLSTAINAIGSVKTSGFSVAAPTSGTSTVGDAKKIFLCDATSGSITATLPAASTTGSGFVVLFKKTDSSTNAVTLTPNGSDTIDGNSTYALSTQYDWAIIVSDGVDAWNIISKTPPQVASETIANNMVFGNISGSSSSPYAVGVSSLLDSVFGTTQGGMLYRGASEWALLSPGTSGYYLKANGASNNPSWAAFPTGNYVSTDQNYSNVGSFSLCSVNDSNCPALGGTVSGSNLRVASLVNTGSGTSTTTRWGTSTLSGTWRNVGTYPAVLGPSYYYVGIFQRIA